MVCTHSLMLLSLLLQLSGTLGRTPHATGSWPGLQPRVLLGDVREARRFLALSGAGLFSLSEWVSY